jgi:hypothetical protein
VHRRLAGFRAEPGVVAVRLKHEDARQTSHPIDVGETLHGAEPL